MQERKWNHYRPYGQEYIERWTPDTETAAAEGVQGDQGAGLRPTDDDVSRMQGWAKEMLSEFVPIMGLSAWTITIDWERGRFQNSLAAMSTTARDEYLDGTISVSIEMAYHFDHSGFRHTLVHELAHFLTLETIGHIPDTDTFRGDMSERVTSHLANAVLRAYVVGGGSK